MRMTIEQALDSLEYNRDALIVARGSDYSGVQAMNMAIRSLKAWEKIKEDIRRKDAMICNMDISAGLGIALGAIDRVLEEVVEE